MELWEDGIVTVMIRQLPKKFTPSMFLQLMIERGFEGLFDFLHLARAMSRGAIRYRPHGFVNFIAPEHALRFRDSLDGQYLNNRQHKPVQVHPATMQARNVHDLHNDAGAPWKCPACGGMNLQWRLACYIKTCCAPRTDEGTGSSSSSSRCLSWTGKPLLELQADP
jgi:hypothetical protein